MPAEAYVAAAGRGPLTRVRLDPSMIVGEGGEAEIFDIGASIAGTALKIFKTDTHPDFQGSDAEKKRAREGARARIQEQQQKLRDFPKKLPGHIVVPRFLAFTREGQKVIGYAMNLLQNAYTMRDLTKPSFRLSGGVDGNYVVEIFRDLHQTVSSLHGAGVTIGDFNNLNVLVLGKEAWVIDADSMQWGNYFCRSFTTRFVDPLICDPKETSLLQNKPHSENTDWYAYLTMLFECMLFVHPYGGVYRANPGMKMIGRDERPLHRISVFHSGVIYPNKAIHFGALPDDVLEYVRQVFEKDKRGAFPLSLLENLRWTKCTACGTEHARALCPKCALAAPTLTKKFIKRGQITVTRKFDSSGVILRAAYQHANVYYVSHEAGEFKRQDGGVLFSGPLEHGMRVRIVGHDTVASLRGRTIRFSPGKQPEQMQVDSYQGRIPMFDTNERNIYWQQGGALYRSGEISPKHIGDVLRGQTLHWVGPNFGFGFYRAGELQRAFVFDAERAGINDSVDLPRLSGELVGANAYFTSKRCWLFVAMKSSSRTIIRCSVISRQGKVIASAEGEENDGSWLGALQGKSAATLLGKNQEELHCLFSASENGLVRVQEDLTRLFEAAAYPDTRDFVDLDGQIFLARDGILNVGRSEIDLIQIA